MRIFSRRVLFVLSLIPVALLMTEIYEHATNTLADNGHWFVTKSEIERRVAFGQYFRDTRVSLRRDRLDLGAWHSPHEVLYKQPLPIERIRFKALLIEGSYLALEFNRDSSSFWAIRLSRSNLYPSALLHVDPSGKFLSRTYLKIPPIESGWVRYELVQKDGQLSLLINGNKVYQTAFESHPIQQFGFRNGHHSVFVDDVSVVSAEGKVVVSETFRNTRHYVLILALSLALAFAISGGIARFFGSTDRGERFLRALTCNLTLTIILAAIFVADWYHFSSITANPLQSFFSHSFTMPEIVNDANSDESVPRDTIEKFSSPGGYRIIFLGSSQTYGEGATTEDDRWVSVIQRKFNALKTRSRCECINAGQAGWSSDQIVQQYKEMWLKTAPDQVVVDLSNNDTDRNLFRQSLETLVALNRKMRIQTLLVQEPNNPEALSNFRQTEGNHRVMEEVAAQHHLPLVQMHKYLSSVPVYDTGFLWWDHVHLTSYGQSLFAEHLFPVLEKLKSASSRKPRGT
jgi:lysophospholipase L1-like esterase